MAAPAESSLPVNRVQALSDGIFAIAMTLMILDFRVPEFSEAPGFLAGYFWALWPKIVCYAMSFLMLGVFWIGHHNQFHFIKKSTRFLIWIDIVFLMLIAFIPFSTAFLGRYWKERAAIDLYGANVVFCGLALYGHWVYAVRNGLAVVQEKVAVRIVGRRILLGMAFYILAMAISLLPCFRPQWSLFIYAVLPFLYLLPGKIDRYWIDQ